MFQQGLRMHQMQPYHIIYFQNFHTEGWETPSFILPPLSGASAFAVALCNKQIPNFFGQLFRALKYRLPFYVIEFQEFVYFSVFPFILPGKVPVLNVSYKPQKISPKSQGTVRQLLHDKIRDAYIHPQFVTDVIKPLQIEHLFDQEVCYSTLF